MIENFKNKNFVFLWLGQIISQFGDRISQMALIGLVADRAPDSALGLAVALSFTIIPVFIFGPVAGVYADRWDRRLTLFVCDFFRGSLVLTIPLVFINSGSMVPIYMIVFLIFCLGRFHIVAKMSIIPDLVDEKDLLSANSLVTTTGMIAAVFGIFFGALIVEYLGAKGGFLCNAITFYVSALLIFFIRKKTQIYMNKSTFINTGKHIILDIKKSVPAEIKEAVLYLKNHKDIRFCVNTLFTLLAAAGAVYIILIVFIQETFGSVTRDLGSLAPFLAIGLFLGSILYGRCGQKISMFKVIFLSLISGGLMMCAFAIGIYQFPNRIFAMGMAFGLGLFIGPIFIASNTIVHKVCADHMRGKVFGGLEVVTHFAFLIAMFTSAYLAKYVQNYLILVGVGAIFSVVGLLGLLRYNKDDKFEEELSHL